MLALKSGNKREPSYSAIAKAMEAAMSLDGSREEPSGVGGAGCCNSRRWNRGGLPRSVAHIHRNCWYKPESEVQGKAEGEVGGGHSTKDHRDNTTRCEGRASTSVESSGEVSDGACPKRANHTHRQITRTPARTIPGGQEEQKPTVSCAL